MMESLSGDVSMDLVEWQQQLLEHGLQQQTQPQILAVQRARTGTSIAAPQHPKPHPEHNLQENEMADYAMHNGATDLPVSLQKVLQL